MAASRLDTKILLYFNSRCVRKDTKSPSPIPQVKTQLAEGTFRPNGGDLQALHYIIIALGGREVSTPSVKHTKACIQTRTFNGDHLFGPKQSFSAAFVHGWTYLSERGLSGLLYFGHFYSPLINVPHPFWPISDICFLLFYSDKGLHKNISHHKVNTVISNKDGVFILTAHACTPSWRSYPEGIRPSRSTGCDYFKVCL